MLVAQTTAVGVSYSSVVSANCGLRAGEDLEAFLFQCVAEALGEVDVAVDQQNFGHARGSIMRALPVLTGASQRALERGAGFGPGVSALRLRTSMTSPSCESQPATCGQVGFAGGNHFGEDEFAIAGDGESDPFGAGGVAALCDQIEAARRESLADESRGDVETGTMRPRRRITPSISFVWCGKRKMRLGATSSAMSPAATAKRRSERRRRTNDSESVGLRAHWAKLAGSMVQGVGSEPAPLKPKGAAPGSEFTGTSDDDSRSVASLWESSAMVDASADPFDCSDESRRKSSSGVRKPSGFTTGTTV